MGIEERLQQLEASNPDLCEQRPCKGPVAMTQKRLMPDGTVEVSGEPPPPLCDACPTRDDPKAPIRHLEVRHGFPPTGDVWEVEDIESDAVEGTVIVKVVYDDAPYPWPWPSSSRSQGSPSCPCVGWSRRSALRPRLWPSEAPRHPTSDRPDGGRSPGDARISALRAILCSRRVPRWYNLGY